MIKNPKREHELSQPKPSPSSLSAINQNKPKPSMVSPLSMPQRQPLTNQVTSTTPRNSAVTSSNQTKGPLPTSTKPAFTGNPAVMQKPIR